MPQQVKFTLGQVVATPGALAALSEAGQTPVEFLMQHARGEWGELDASDRRANDEAIAHEEDPGQRQRVLSSYRIRTNQTIWIITEHDRSVTTVLLPEEY